MFFCRYVKGVNNVPPVFILHYFVIFVNSFFSTGRKSHNFSYGEQDTASIESSQ